MKNLPRSHSKKEWRTHIEKCCTVQEKLQECIQATPEYSRMSSIIRHVIDESISKGFLYEYIDTFKSGRINFSTESKLFYNKESALWIKNPTLLQAIDEKCNLFSLFECAEETYNLKNLEGSYEYAKRLFK